MFWFSLFSYYYTSDKDIVTKNCFHAFYNLIYSQQFRLEIINLALMTTGENNLNIKKT